MTDYGFPAALRVALRFFEFASRGTGRTEAMIAAAADGDIIVTCQEAERRRLIGLLKEVGKDVRVITSDPRRWPEPNAQGLMAKGALVFDHNFQERFWAASIERTGDQLRAFAAHCSRREPEKQAASREAQIVDRMDREI